MAKVPLIPFQRPVPQVFLRKAVPSGVKAVKGRKDTMVATKSTTKKAKFEVTNLSDITSKPKILQDLWKILSKMDPDGTFQQDIGLIGLAGEVAKNRTPKALGLTPEQVALITPYGVLDSPDQADNPETATGVLFTVYQLIELAYAIGAQQEAAKVTAAIAAAASDVDLDDDEDEDFDDVVDVVSEDADDEADDIDDDNDEVEEDVDDDEEEVDDDEDEG